MIEVENGAHVNAGVEDVFRFVTDATNEPKWHTDVLSVEPLQEGPMKVGNTYRWTMRFMGKREGMVEVVGLEPNRLAQLAVRKGPMGLTPTITLRFEPDGNGSRFSRAVLMEPKGFSKMMAPMMRSMVPKKNAEFVQNLAKLFEQGGTAR
jgi:uncharacterized protein YndB with AHSA1/START domain